MIEVKINGITKWQVNEYTFTDPQMGIRSISLTVTHPSDNTAVPSFVGAYVEYEGERYDIVNSKPTAEKGIDSINYKYNLIFNGQEAELQRRKIRNLATVGVDAFISQGTSFSLYADINQFKQLLENNLKYYFGNRWTINLGSTTSESVMVSVNNMFIWDLLLKTFEYYGLRWNITGNTINIGYTPDVIQHVFDYGYNGGLVKITRTAQSEPAINRLAGVGGSRNVPINYFTDRYSDFPVDPNPISGDVNINNIMPKVFRDSVIAGTLPYIDYVEDAELVASEGVKEDALEPNEDIYPSIAGVEVAGLGRIDQIIAASVPTANTPDDAGYSPTFDIWVKDIGFDLADNQYTATQDAKISFTSGMLAGYEFVILATNGVRNVVVDTTKSHGGVSSKYKITLINSSEDFTATGRMLPNSVIKAMAGDSFVIYDIIMPQPYVELAELRVQNWLNEQLDVKKVEKPTYAIEPTDTFFEENIAPESDGKTIREKLKSGNKLTVNNTKVTDGAQELHINNITIQYGGVLPKYSFVVTDKVSVQGSAIARLTNEIQKTDNSVQGADKKIVKLQQYSDRQWKEIQETITLLGAAIDGFSTGINPITVQTMQILVGNESLQFRFVNSKTAPVTVSHAFNWDDVLKSFTTTSGIIQHMTLGITEISSNHPVSAYKFWDIASYSNNTLVAEKPYYLYSKCSRTTSGAVFLLSDVPIGMYDDANYYYFLTGILNSEDSDGGRSFVSLYGFTEILPGRITTDKIVSSDGLTYFDLLNGVIGGKIRFTSTGGGETNLDEWADGTSQDIQDAQAAANAAALAAQQAIEDAEANVGLINTEVGKLQAQIDGEVSNWFYPYTPTLANYPASEWTTNAEKGRHIGDTFTNTQAFVNNATTPDAGKSWRFVKNGTSYSWTLIADSDAIKALQQAAQAQSTADGKSTTFLIQPAKYHLGDMWVLATDITLNGTAYKAGEILTATQDSATYNEKHWVKRVRYTDDTAVENLKTGTVNLINGSKKLRVAGGLIIIPADKAIAGDEYVLSVGRSTYIGGASENVNKTIFFLFSSDDKLRIYTSISSDRKSIKFKVPTTNLAIAICATSAWSGITDFEEIILTKGNQIVDWSESPEDVQAEIDAAKQEALDAASDAQSTADSLKDFTDTAFRDGIIDRSESVAIEKYKNSLNETMSKAEASYMKVFHNTYLEGDAKTDLEHAKINLWGQRDTLLSAINTAISGGTTTPAQKTAVDNAFSTFNSLMTAFQNALEEANKAIQTKLDDLSTEKVNNIEIGGRNLIVLQNVVDKNGRLNQPTNSTIYIYGDAGYYTTDKIYVNEGDKLVLTSHRIIGGYLALGYFDEDDIYFSRPIMVTNFEANSYVLTIPSRAAYVRVSFLGSESNYIKLEKGNKATDWTPAPEDVQAEIDANKLAAERAQLQADGFMRARYVRDWAKGNNINTGNHWAEIQVVNKAGQNIALSKSVEGNGAWSGSYIGGNAVDGNTETWAAISGTTPATHNYIVIDLGSIYYDIDYVKVIHPASAGYGRTYYGTKTEISEDGVNWTTIFDSAVEGTYAETAEGKIHTQRYANVVSKLNRAKAITDKFGTEINGGLITTVMMLLREANSQINTAGFSGIQEDGYSPAYWSGGTYEQALAFSELMRAVDRGDNPIAFATLNAEMSSIALLHNGHAKLGELIVKSNGQIVILDKIAGKIKFVINSQNIPSIADLMDDAVFGETEDNTAVGGITDTITLTKKISVTKDNSTINFGGTISVSVRNNTNFARATITAELHKDGNYYARLGSVLATKNGITSEPASASSVINKILTGVGAGQYSVKLIVNTTGDVSDYSGSISASTLGWSFTQSGVRYFQLGLNGLMAFYSNNHFHYTEDGGLDVRGKTNMPGVLASGSVSSTGIQTNVWGAKSSSAGAGTITGGRSVPLSNLTHNNYTVIITPHTATTFRVGSKTTSSFQALGTGGFDYVVIGNNY